MRNHDSTIKKISTFLGILILAIFTSQCFAQSNSATSKNVKSRQYLELVNGLYDWIQRNYVDEVDPEVLYRGALKGMLSELNDPYTTYMDTSLNRSLNDTSHGQFGGVGLTITKLLESSATKPAYVEVISPVEDTPGYRAGIQAGDFLISINGTDTSKINMEEVLDILRGHVGDPVDIVVRRGKNTEFSVTLVRELIEVPTVKFTTIGNLGYLKIIEFTPLTPEKVQQALDVFKKEQVKGIIIDLRNNGGGVLSSGVDVADKFIDNGPIVSTKSRIAYENSMFTASPKRTVVRDIPMVVLINRGTASAAEILSGALKDNHLAYLVGQRTFGKGSVQKVMPLSEKDGIKCTVARYYTPSDVNIDKIGIPPDREILFPLLSEEGEKQYTELYKEDEISKYVADNGGANMTEKQISEYAKVLKSKYTEIDEASLRKLIRNDVNRYNSSMLYDLDYDIQLNEAIKILKTENFTKLVKNTKTLKELQDLAQLEDKSKEDSKKAE